MTLSGISTSYNCNEKIDPGLLQKFNKAKMNNLRFYKDSNNEWYADVPGWTGTYAQLQMVSGADTLLDLMANGRNEVLITFSETDFENAECLEPDHLAIRNLILDSDSGANYILNSYDGIDMDLKVWLCNVTEFVFGYFPERIFFSKFQP